MINFQIYKTHIKPIKPALKTHKTGRVGLYDKTRVLSLSKAVGPVGPSFLVVKKTHFNNKYSFYREFANSTKQKVHVGSQYSKTCLKQPLKIDKTLIINCSLMKVESIEECSPWSILQYF